MAEILNNLILIRPHALWILPAALLLVFLLYRYGNSGSSWSNIIAPELLKHLLPNTVQGTGKKKLAPFIGLFVVLCLLIIALAGPAYHKIPQPVYASEKGLFIILDLSPNMYAQDIAPSRLQRAKYKITDLIQDHFTGKVALVAAGSDTYTVAPLTNDNQTIIQMLSGLQPLTLPAWQQNRFNLTDALSKVSNMLESSKTSKSDANILVVTASEPSSQVFKVADTLGLPLNVLALGTQTGAPVNIPGQGFMQDNTGTQIIAKTPISDLQKIAAKTGGYFALLGNNDADIKHLSQAWQSSITGYEQDGERNTDVWREEGPWILLLLLPFLALIFRRGWVS